MGCSTLFYVLNGLSTFFTVFLLYYLFYGFVTWACAIYLLLLSFSLAVVNTFILVCTYFLIGILFLFLSSIWLEVFLYDILGVALVDAILLILKLILFVGFILLVLLICWFVGVVLTILVLFVCWLFIYFSYNFVLYNYTWFTTSQTDTYVLFMFKEYLHNCEFCINFNDTKLAYNF